MKTFPQPGTLIERYNRRRLGSTLCEHGMSRPHFFWGNNDRVAQKRVQFTYKGKDYDVMTPLPPSMSKVASEWLK